MKESKRKIDEDCGIKLSEKFNKISIFGRKLRKKRGGVGCVNVRILRDNGICVSGKAKVKEV